LRSYFQLKKTETAKEACLIAANHQIPTLHGTVRLAVFYILALLTHKIHTKTLDG